MSTFFTYIDYKYSIIITHFLQRLFQTLDGKKWAFFTCNSDIIDDDTLFEQTVEGFDNVLRIPAEQPSYRSGLGNPNRQYLSIAAQVCDERSGRAGSRYHPI